MSELFKAWKRVGLFLPLCLFCLAGVGCQNQLHDENMKLHDQNVELQADLTAANAKLSASANPADLAAAQAEIKARDEQIAQLQASLQKPAAGGAADPSLGGIQATYDAAAGTLTVNLPGDVLFDAGKADVKASAQDTLNKIVAAIRKDYSGKRVMVEGYTDSDPITKTKAQWDDNWDLSYGRAKAVSQYLTSHGVDTKLVAIVANGSNKPKSSKPASRRVEIVVSTR